jgi:hypothetical protein
LEPAKKRVDLFRNIFASTSEISLETVGGSGEREVGISRVLTARSDGDPVDGVIEGFPKIPDKGWVSQRIYCLCLV